MRYPEHIPGTKDYIEDDARRLLRTTDACAQTFALYGYERIILPVLERSDIFLQRSGEEIRSRMYILNDPKGKEICLRPEMTISVARAYLERMSSRRLPVRLCYQGSMFRYDKIREGRYRQFIQAGVESIGIQNRIAADTEVVSLALDSMKRAGL
jgi:ATP phosphoribosyltransferase regulatory subunit HisZ